MPRHGAAININLTELAHAGWEAWADRHGTTVTALIETIGLAVADQPDKRQLGLEDIGRRARELSQSRKRRRRPPSE